MSRMLRPIVHQAEGACRTIEPNTATLLLGTGPSGALGFIGAGGGGGALIITGVYPGRLRARFGLEGAEILWVSDHTAGKDEKMGPGDLEHRILSRALKHLRGGGLLLLDDIEYLLFQRGFEALARFLKCISDAAPHGKGRLHVVADPEAFSKYQLGSILRFFDKVITVERKKEEKRNPASFVLPSTSYLVDGMGESSYRYIRSKLNDRKVVCVTLVPPLRLKERYGFESTEFLWLTDVGQGRNLFRPEKLCCDVLRTIMHMMNTGKTPVLFLDSLDQLLLYVDFAQVLRFVKSVDDAISVKGSSLIAMADLGSLDTAHRAALQRRFEISVWCD